MRQPWTRPPRVPLLLGLLSLSACGYQVPQPPSPGGNPRGLARSTMIGYAAGLPFRTRLGAAAQQLLQEENVVVRLEPELSSFSLTRERLDEGRVVARFRKAPGGSVRRFGLAEADTLSYWLVYREGDEYYGRFYSETMDTTYRIVVTHHGKPDNHLEQNLPWAQAIAQFQYWGDGAPEEDDGAPGGAPGRVLAAAISGTGGWVTCTPYDCCRTQ